MLRARDAVVFGPPVPSLVCWGRSADADLVYRTLVTYGSGTAAELRRELGLTRRRVAVALDELASFDAAHPEPGTSGDGAVWTASRPSLVIDSLRRGRPKHPAPPTAGTDADHLDLVDGEGLRHLRTRALTRDRLARLSRVAAYEQLAMTPDVTFDSESGRAGAATDRLLLSRGVRMRVLGVHPADPDPMLQHGRRADEPGPAYRAASSVPMKLIIVDRRIAFFPVAPSDLDRGYLEVSQAPVVTALVSLFERHWETARDPWDLAVPRVALDRREHELVTLLAAGHTDASAAGVLQVSARSVTSIIRGLMDRLNVDNRFQLGLVLGALRAGTPPGQLTHRSPSTRERQ